MSAAAFGKAIGPIAKKIGGEVAEGLSKTADDWGWKGPKKGEISGGEYKRKQKELSNEFEILFDRNPRSTVSMAEFSALPKHKELRKKREDLMTKFLKQQKIDVSQSYSKRNFESSLRAQQFSVLEEANIPRRWTGKLREAIIKNDPDYYDDARIGDEYVNFQDLSKAMEGMTESQRETLVTLIPGWSDTFKKLVEVSRSL